MKRLVLVKAWRCVRRTPFAAWDAFWEPFYDSGQAWTVLVASVIAFIAASKATFGALLTMASEWASFAQAIGYAVMIWAVLSAIRSPCIVVSRDRKSGAWHDNKFIYHRPLLVATIHCTRADADHRYHFKVADAEPDSMVYCTVEFDRPVGNLYAQLGGDIFTSNRPGPNSYSMFRLRPGNMGTMILHDGPPDYLGLTARIYCHQFEVMND